MSNVNKQLIQIISVDRNCLHLIGPEWNPFRPISKKKIGPERKGRKDVGRYVGNPKKCMLFLIVQLKKE
jgi:hypothetical protein